MFFEDVPIEVGANSTLNGMFRAYGIDDGMLGGVLNGPENAALRQSAGGAITLFTDLTKRLQSVQSVRLPINLTATGTARPVVDLRNGLQAVKTFGPGGPLLTHGVVARLTSTHRGCPQIRWLQTVVKEIRSVSPPDTSEFVDTTGAGMQLPWYDLPTDVRKLTEPAPTVLDDTPCGPEASAPNKGMIWRGTASVAVWTNRRITLVRSFVYGFVIEVGKTVQAVRLDPPLRDANDVEVQKHLAILRSGKGRDGGRTGATLDYRRPPADKAINQ